MPILYLDSASFNSVQVSGSLVLSGSTVIQGTSSWANNALTASAITTLNQNVTVSGSMVVTQNLTVLGTASYNFITASQLDLGSNTITVNTSTPEVRYAGLAVIDSGSTNLSGSLLFDSQNNQWIYIHQSSPGSALTSSVLIMGPQTFNNVGNETTITANRLTKGTGGDLGEHIGNSNVSDNGAVVSINSNTEITGSLTLVNGGVTGSLLGTASFATTASYALASPGGGPGGDTTAIEAQLWFLI